MPKLLSGLSPCPPFPGFSPHCSQSDLFKVHQCFGLTCKVLQDLRLTPSPDSFLTTPSLRFYIIILFNLVPFCTCCSHYLEFSFLPSLSGWHLLFLQVNLGINYFSRNPSLIPLRRIKCPDCFQSSWAIYVPSPYWIESHGTACLILIATTRPETREHR